MKYIINCILAIVLCQLIGCSTSTMQCESWNVSDKQRCIEDVKIIQEQLYRNCFDCKPR